MGVETENFEIAAKRFENTFRAMGIRDFRSSQSRNTGGAFKGPYKSESSLMTCAAELHGSVTRMVYSILSLMGNQERLCWRQNELSWHEVRFFTTQTQFTDCLKTDTATNKTTPFNPETSPKSELGKKFKKQPKSVPPHGPRANASTWPFSG